MKKRLLSTLLVFCMVLSLLPGTAWAANYVAQVGNTKYETLEQAIEAAKSSQTVKLLSPVNNQASISIEKGITLDLDNYPINFVTNGTLCITTSDAVTIKGSGEEAGIWQAANSSEPAVRVGSESSTSPVTTANVTISGITIEGYHGILVRGSGSKLVVNDCTIKADDMGDGIVTNGGDTNVSVTVTDSTIVAGLGMYLPSARSTYVINGSSTSITGKGAQTATGIEIRGGKLTVNGGTIKSESTTKTSTTIDQTYINNGSTVDGAGIAVSPYSDRDVEIDIRGGNISGPTALYFADIVETTHDIKASITGGTFEGTQNAIGFYDQSSRASYPKAFIKGGTFSSDLDSTLLDPNYRTVGSNPWKVIPKDDEESTSNVATVGDLFYNSLENAIAAAQAGYDNTVTLLKNIIDIDVKNDIIINAGTVDQPITIQTGGNTWTLDSHTITVSGNLAITGSGEIIGGTSPIVTVENRGKLTLQDAAIKSSLANGVGILVDTGSTAEIKGSGKVEMEGDNATGVRIEQGGTLDVSEKAAIRANGSNSIAIEGRYEASNTTPTAVTIKGNAGIQAENGCAIYHPQYGTMEIGGNATIKGKAGIVACGGDIKINGGTIEATSTDDISVSEGSYSPAGAGILFADQGTNARGGSLEITRGTVKGAGKNAVIYTKGSKTPVPTDADKPIVRITGGTFSSDVRTYADSGTTTNFVDKDHTVEPVIVENETLHSVVLANANNVAVVISGDTYTYFERLDATPGAIAAATNGDIVRLLKNLDCSSGSIEIDKDIIFDFDGYTVTFSEDATGFSISESAKNVTFETSSTSEGNTIEANGPNPAISVEASDANITLRNLSINISTTADGKTTASGTGIEMTSGELTIEDSAFACETAINATGGTTTISISGSTFNCTGTGIDMATGTLDIKNSDFTCDTAIKASGDADIGISGGEFICKTVIDAPESTKSEDGGTNIRINGGSFKHAASEGDINSTGITMKEGTLEITDASFTYNTGIAATGGNIDIDISGGSFTCNTAIAAPASGSGSSIDISGSTFNFTSSPGDIGIKMNEGTLNITAGSTFGNRVKTTNQNCGTAVDASGKAIIYIANSEFYCTGTAIKMKSGTLDITNSDFTCKDAINADVGSNDELEITINGESYFTCEDGTGVTMTAGKLTIEDETYFLTCNNAVIATAGNIIINGGKFNCAETGITMTSDSAALTIYGGTFECENAISTTGNDIKIHGGIFHNSRRTFTGTPAEGKVKIYDGIFTTMEDEDSKIGETPAPDWEVEPYLDTGLTLDEKNVIGKVINAPGVYTVTFDPNGGEFTGEAGNSTEIKVLRTVYDEDTKSSKLTDNWPEDPIRTDGNYSFLGWYTKDGSKKFTKDDTFTENTDLHAEWKKELPFDITFDYNYEGSPESVTVQTRPNIGTVREENWLIPTRDDYRFDGWFLEDGTTEIQSDKEFEGDTTLYAKWTQVIFTITFDPNEGTLNGSTEPVKLKTDTAEEDGEDAPKVYLSELPEPKRDGFTFKGWYLEDGTEVTTATKFTENITVYAKWAGTRVITFDLGYSTSGSSTYATKETDDDGNLAQSDWPSDPTRPGYTFDGWYTQKNGEGDKVTPATTFNSSTTVYANWLSGSSYTITFDLNYTGAPDSTTAKTDNTGKLASLPAPTREGYTFDAWYDAPTDGNKITTSTVFTKDTTVYAYWTEADKAEIFTITFDYNYEGAPASTTAATGSDGKLTSLPAPTREGYTLDGWYTEATGGTQVTTATVFTANTTVYAHWTVTNDPGTSDPGQSGTVYTITFDYNYEGAPASTTATTGKDGKLSSLPTPTRSGYSFSGWYTAATDGTRVTTSTVFSADTTIYAQWTKLGDYQITVRADPASGGNVTGGGYYDKGASVTVRAYPASGYYFECWEDEDGVMVSSDRDYTFTVTAGRTLTAVFVSGSSDLTYQISTPAASNGTVTTNVKTARSGQRITITATPNSGYTTASVTVTDRKGDIVSVSNNGNGTWTFTMPASKATVSAVFTAVETPSTAGTSSSASNGTSSTTGGASYGTPWVSPMANVVYGAAWSSPFMDVNTGDWFYHDVSYMVRGGLMNGVSSQVFDPSGTTTRGMIMTILARLSGVDTSTSIPWYRLGVSWAVRAEVSNGENPEADITREEFVTMLWRYAGKPAVTGNLSAYPDAGEVHGWASSAMIWAVQKGIVIGSDGWLNPQGHARRSEASAMLARFCRNVGL